MCHASCLGLEALKFSETGLCECSEVLSRWDKQGSPPVCVAPGTLPCQTLLRLTCLHSTVPVPIWHPRTPAPDPAAPPDTRHSQPTEEPRHCTLRYHQAPGHAGPSAQVLVLPCDTCSFSEQPQYPSAFPKTEHQRQAPKTEPSTLSLFCTEWSKDSFYSLDPIFTLICPKSPIRRLQPRARPPC